MAELRQNTWSLNAWYEQDYAGNVSYNGIGELFCLGGDNDYGALGTNSEGDASRFSSPVQIPGTNWAKHASGSGDTNYQRAAIKSDGTLWFWGRAQYGTFGTNSNVSHSSPVQCPGTWNSVALQNLQSMGTKTDGTLWTWGAASNGVLGLNGPDNVHQSSPCQIGTGTDWSSSTIDTKDKITAGYRNNSAIKTDGTLWTWGRNDDGQIGDNSVIQRSSPVQVPGTTWNSNAMMIYACLATKTDGTMWAWGGNGHGQLGHNNRTQYSSPIQVGTDTTWGSLYISAARYTVRVVKTDGTLWAWGNNSGGGLGQNNQTQYSSPVQIPGTNWKQVSVSDDGQTTAVKTDGTLWGWGFNGKGGLGHNNRTYYSSPVQIPGTDWHLTRSARQAGYAIKLK